MFPLVTVRLNNIIIVIIILPFSLFSLSMLLAPLKLANNDNKKSFIDIKGEEETEMYFENWKLPSEASVRDNLLTVYM